MKAIKNKYFLRSIIAVAIWTFFKIATAPDMDEMTTFDSDSLVYLISTVLITFIVFEAVDRTFNYWKEKYQAQFTDPRNLLTFGLTAIAVSSCFLVPFNYGLEYHVEDWFGCTDYGDERTEFIRSNIFSTFFVVVILSGYVINFMYGQRKQMELVQEKLNKENIAFQYESLKSQLNPHFLFNSFSVLTSLVHANPDIASDFIAQLSKIYRYVLENKQKELIELEEELSFLKSYIFLMKIRHDNSLQVSYNITVPTDVYFIPTLSLQLLAENAVKHNSFSDSKPLKVEVFNEGEEFLVVRNTRTAVRKRVVNSTGVGLKNIEKRYALNDSALPVIEDTEDFFTVKLPLIQKVFA